MDIQDFKNEIKQISEKIKIGISCVNLEEKNEKIAELKAKTEEPTFWDDAKEAGKISQELAETEKSRDLWVNLESDIQNISEMLEMLELEFSDDSTALENSEDFAEIISEFEKVKKNFETSRARIVAFWRIRFSKCTS